MTQSHIFSVYFYSVHAADNRDELKHNSNYKAGMENGNKHNCFSTTTAH